MTYDPNKDQAGTPQTEGKRDPRFQALSRLLARKAAEEDFRKFLASRAKTNTPNTREPT